MCISMLNFNVLFGNLSYPIDILYLSFNVCLIAFFGLPLFYKKNTLILMDYLWKKCNFGGSFKILEKKLFECDLNH
ncbi:hypothetical protein D3C87_511380 [compost metagenome]